MAFDQIDATCIERSLVLTRDTRISFNIRNAFDDIRVRFLML